MNEPLFGSVAPMWSGLPTPGFGWPVTSGPIFATARPAAFGSQQFPQVNTPMTGVPGPQAGNVLSPELFGFGPGPISPVQPMSFAPSPFPPFVGPEIPGNYGISILLATVAMRRGQPMGPTNDQECEDFIYDALELIPGTSEVEVRCENGRATLTGSVHHKRLKHDLGEIAWTIPSVADVQNNITIATRRRSRSGRETEAQASSPGRKQT